ncbi:phage tail spike protein [Microbacterium karelineae]|uniref:phage tail spike protein n=1 Tax=Microbacterium karelineae TaxID=2654283 RepID=UPI0018D3CCF8|nr:phage tail spike protein [Microbacterium karelineae]
MPVQTLWNDRLAWSGEVPLDYPGLNPVTLTRFHEIAIWAAGPAYEDVADTVNTASWRLWYESGGSANAFTEAGQWGEGARLNATDPSASQSWIGRGGSGGHAPPQGMTSGRYLVGMWYDHAYTMAHIPLITTRGDGTATPLFHLATVNYGSLRHQVYDDAGTALLDQFEGTPPWGTPTTSQWVGQLIDFDAGTSQILAANFATHEWWISPARAIGGTPNTAPGAQIRVYGMGDAAAYWAGGGVDEFLTARPDATFDAETFLDALARGTFSTGQAAGHGDVLAVTDAEVTGPTGGTGGSDRTFYTGAVPLRWQDGATFAPLAGHSHSWAAQGSTDDGATWADLSDPPPASFDGLVRFRVYLADDTKSFAGMDVDIAEVGAPVMDPISDVTIGEGTSDTVEVSSTDGWRPVTYSAASSDEAVAAVSVSGTTLTIDGGTPGSATVTVTATDADGQTGETTFTVTVEMIAPDPPVIDPIMPIDLEAGTAETVTLTATGDGGPFSWSAVEDDPGSLVSVSISGDQMTVGAGFGEGTAQVDVTVTDSYGQTDTVTFPVTVLLPPTPEPVIPRYAREPIIVGDGADAAAIVDPVAGVVVREVNGEQTLTFGLPIKHRHGGAILPEAPVEHAGIPYRVRRIETGREAGTPVMSVYCEEDFYDLAYAGQLDAREYRQVTALQAMTDALAGTEWSIGTVNVATRRTYAVEVTNPLELLRTVQANHGGDLLFDSVARTVSLVTKSGRDVGVAFVYGRGLTESKRVVDTTSLVTRIYARNADGQTIASVNGGEAYVEDFTYTSEVREATYDFAAGTSPYTMLSMASATLANRSRPSYSYEFTVADLSWQTRQEIDRFDVGDVVTVVDDELGIREAQRIVAIEHDIVRPARTKITLSAKLRELGSSTGDEGGVTTGSQQSTFDLVPYNLLKNSRFDGGLQHWGSLGVDAVEAAQGTGDMAARFTGSGERWIEQTVQPDNRDAYSLSFDIESSGPQGWTPDVRAIAEVTYEDGSTETITLELT